MTVLGFGLNHKTASLPLLERVSLNPDAMQALLADLCSHDHIFEAFGLCTCNRTEFLIVAPNSHQALSTLFDGIQKVRSVDLRAEADHTFFYAEDEAIRHIFRVACGIDSLVIGENEILGQLRKARETASDAGYIAEVLEPILLRAIDVGRRARQATTISRGNVSVSSVAATLATRDLGNLREKEGLVLGAGETARAAALQLNERGIKSLTIANRTYEKGRQLAQEIGAREAGMDQLEEILTGADVVVCATGASDYIVTMPMVEKVMRTRDRKPLLFLDVSVPRNVDPVIDELPDVHVYSLEHLSQLAEENRQMRENQVREVDNLIDRELTSYRASLTFRDVDCLIAGIHRRIEQIRKDHLDRNNHYFQNGAREHLEAFSSGLTRSLLHDLVENLRSINLDTVEGRHRLQVARELFNQTLEEKI